ncbi:hypothetical protein MPC1_5770002 [Methylocella tundrae]|nr:hypothetical protein MPC1_5770002 [Methylocella tundrae]
MGRRGVGQAWGRRQTVRAILDGVALAPRIAAIEDRLMLATVCLTTIDDFADMEAVLQYVGERPTSAHWEIATYHPSCIGALDDLGLTENEDTGLLRHLRTFSRGGASCASKNR